MDAGLIRCARIRRLGSGSSRHQQWQKSAITPVDPRAKAEGVAFSPERALLAHRKRRQDSTNMGAPSRDPATKDRHQDMGPGVAFSRMGSGSPHAGEETAWLWRSDGAWASAATSPSTSKRRERLSHEGLAQEGPGAETPTRHRWGRGRSFRYHEEECAQELTAISISGGRSNPTCASIGSELSVAPSRAVDRERQAAWTRRQKQCATRSRSLFMARHSERFVDGVGAKRRHRQFFEQTTSVCLIIS